MDQDVTGYADGGCRICWRDETFGLMVKDPQVTGYVHVSCLRWFGVDSAVEFERQYYDE